MFLLIRLTIVSFESTTHSPFDSSIPMPSAPTDVVITTVPHASACGIFIFSPDPICIGATIIIWEAKNPSISSIKPR
jgi:hypothetical protein